MNEIKSIGPWPENSITDLNNARIKLMEASSQLTMDLRKKIGEHISFPRIDTYSNIPNLYLPLITSRTLDYRLQQTEVTYRQFIERNNLAKIHEGKQREGTYAALVLGHLVVIITDIELSTTKHCSYCDNTFSLHREAVKLSDGSLICDDCYKRVFDSILVVTHKG